MGAWLQAISTGAGDFGSALGRAGEYNLQSLIKRHQQNFQDSLARLKTLIALRQLQQSKPEGIIPLPGGGTASIAWNPVTGKMTEQTLVKPYIDVPSAQAQIDELTAELPKQYQPAMRIFGMSLKGGSDPAKVVAAAQPRPTTSGQSTYGTGCSRLRRSPPSRRGCTASTGSRDGAGRHSEARFIAGSETTPGIRLSILSFPGRRRDFSVALAV